MTRQRLGNHGLRHILHRFGKVEHRIAAKISGREDYVLDLNAVHANEAMSKIIEAHAELRSAIGSFEVPGIGTKTNIGLRCDSATRGARLVNFAAGQAARDIDPIIWAQRWMTHTKLGRVAVLETGQDDATNIRPAITVSIFEKNNIGRASHEKAAAPGHDAIRERQAVCENRSLLVATIAIDVFEQGDDSSGGLARSWTSRIAAIFDDVEATAFIEGHCHRRDHQRFGGD